VCDSVWCEFTVPVIVDFKEIVSEVKVFALTYETRFCLEFWRLCFCSLCEHFDFGYIIDNRLFCTFGVGVWYIRSS